MTWPLLQHPSRTQQWRPKLTPYRSFVLISTIGLGISKAIATARGLSIAATHIEWIASVLLFCLVYVLGLSEHGSDPPSYNRFLTWFFTYDILQSGSLQHEYAHSRLIITGYRLLTTLSVTLFGVVKAYLMYRGQSRAGDTVDWVLGVIITSCLYVLGLYEDNPGNLMPYLFATDCSPIVYTGLRTIICLASASFSSLCVKIAFEMTFFPLSDLRTIYNQPLEPDVHVYSGKMPLPQPLAMGLSNLAMLFFKTIFFHLLYFIASIFASLLSLFLFVKSIGVFPFIRVSFVAVMTRLRVRSFFNTRTTRFVLKIISCLIILTIWTIFLAAITYLLLDISLLLFLLKFDASIWSVPLWYLICFPSSVVYLLLSVLSFVSFVACLYYLAGLLCVLCYLVAARKLPAIFENSGTRRVFGVPSFVLDIF